VSGALNAIGPVGPVVAPPAVLSEFDPRAAAGAAVDPAAATFAA
jgi:hypothetical protein